MSDRIYFKLERYKRDPLLTLVTCSSKEIFEELMSEINFIITIEAHKLEEDVLYMYERSESHYKELWEMQLIKSQDSSTGQYVAIMGYRIGKKEKINISI